MRQAIVDRVMRQVQAKPAVGFGHGDLVAAARALPAPGVAVQRQGGRPDVSEAHAGPSFPGAQASIPIGPPDDESEREADRAAAMVRSTDAAGPGPASRIGARGGPTIAARQALSGASLAIGAIPAADVARATASGAPLPNDVRERLEPQLGHGFGDVRVHTGSEAVASARSIHALAYTIGRDVVFGAGQYAPHTSAGRSLLAHELTHVVQQHGAEGQARRVQRADENELPTRAGKGSPQLRARAQAIIDQVSVLIRSDKTILDNLRGPDLEGLLRLLDSTRDAGTTHLSWMIRTVTDPEEREMRDLLIAGVTSDALRARLIDIVVFDTHGGGDINQQWLVVALLERMSDSGIQRFIVPHARVAGLRYAVRDPDARLRLDKRLEASMTVVSQWVESNAVAGIKTDAQSATVGMSADDAKWMQSAGDEIAQNTKETLADLRANFDREMAAAGNATAAREAAYDKFALGNAKIEQSAKLQVQMSRRYHVVFKVGADIPQREMGTAPAVERSPWSVSELQFIDSVLAKLPMPYLGRIRAITRFKTPLEGTTAASWSEKNLSLNVFDETFKSPPAEVERRIVHEIGHSTMPERTEIVESGSFSRLPARDWMALSDWKPATKGMLAVDLGVEGQQLTNAIASASAQADNISNRDVIPVPVGGRMLVADRYEPKRGIAGLAPHEQFLHYDAKHDAEFPTPYSRAHPAEDFADCFALFTLHPADAQRRLDVPPGGNNKWSYLQGHRRKVIQGDMAAYPRMTPWQLAQLDLGPTTGAPAPPAGQVQAAPSLADYARAAAIARTIFGEVGLSSDPDAGPLPAVGRAPTDPELDALALQLEAILGVGQTASMVTKAIPPPGPARREWVRAKVRMTEDGHGFTWKLYEHNRWMALPLSDEVVAKDLRRFAPHGAYEGSYRITQQERTLWNWTPSGVAFFNPVDSLVYLPPRFDLKDPRNLDTARHELVHAVAGGQRTNAAFKREFGDDWLAYWEPFEEGLAEITAMEAMHQTITASQYGPGIDWMRKVMVPPGNRETILKAYFSGTVPQEVFALLRDRASFGPPPQIAERDRRSAAPTPAPP